MEATRFTIVEWTKTPLISTFILSRDASLADQVLNHGQHRYVLIGGLSDDVAVTLGQDASLFCICCSFSWALGPCTTVPCPANK